MIYCNCMTWRFGVGFVNRGENENLEETFCFCPWCGNKLKKAVGVTMKESTTTATPSFDDKCPFCSTETSWVYHFGEPCPRIKAIEYYPNGRIKRIEFRDDYCPNPCYPYWYPTIIWNEPWTIYPSTISPYEYTTSKTRETTTLRWEDVSDPN
ncbi:MAG: hypothetical protein FK733_00080 [Asgard group archaeon]|nr:hypothetical protein [Asgard group archaeon]